MTRPVHTLRVIGRSGVLAWRRLPVSGLPAEVGRRAREKAAVGRGSFIRSVVAPLAEGSSAMVSYATVLAGHTLNLHASLPPDTPPTATVDLLIGQDGHRYAVPARLRAPKGADGRPSVTVTALLGGRIGGVPVTAGPCSLALRLSDGTHRAADRELRLVGSGRAPVLSGPTKALGSCPRTGARYRLGLSPTGRLRVVVGAPAPGAEITRIRRSFAGLSLDFQLSGGTAAGRLHVTDGHQEIELPCQQGPDGSMLSCTVPLRTLVTRHQGRRWGFCWTTTGGERIWLRRRPDELSSVRTMLSTTGRLVIVDAAGALHYVGQRHTIRGTYQLHFSPVPLPPGGNAPAAPSDPPSATSTGTPE